MEELYKNIKRLRIERGLSQQELADSTGYTDRSSIAKIERGQVDLSLTKIKIFAHALRVTPGELMGRSPADREREKEDLKPIIAPILGRIPAGYPLEAIEDRTGEEELSPLQYDRSKQYFCLTIHGDSMYPKYIEGDTVVFEWCQDCESGADCAVAVNGFDATFKKVIKRPDCIVLQPLNPEYEPIIVDPMNEDTPVTIYGVAREIRRSV